jgi:hypothetical protein
MIMPLFLSIHTFPVGAFTLDNVTQMAQMGQQDNVVRGHYSTGNLHEGKALCTFEAPSRDDLAEWFGRMGMPYDAIMPAEWEGERGTIQTL